MKILLLLSLLSMMLSCIRQGNSGQIKDRLADSSVSSHVSPLLSQVVKSDTADVKPNRPDMDPNLQVSLEKIITDTVEFVDFNDDGDYFLCSVKKGRRKFSLVYDLISDRKMDFLRGDTLEIKWKRDSIRLAGDEESLDFANWLTEVRKLKDGKTAMFRRSYSKPLKYWYATDTKYTDSYQDYLYHLMEYYIANSKLELVNLYSERQQNTEFGYSIEEQERNGRYYTVLGLSNDMGEHFTVIQWLYIDTENRTLYEYDLANDKLIEFP
ncbi:hypothetical protein FAZ19_09155 [Sphingobacterium alkalisoli]|uniref:Uncharacterized protein n=1 Tax=Sphingobacterium alkalisoli TaxID=1874115 RepID=A0A4U0H5R3_9SPHI|nr:hypothetical protein [Sphingobacterium alkalisoli]TJY67050.1 hypothetical protein FAZ19_09155 [Sphingobacterium alkalisoli]